MFLFFYWSFGHMNVESEVILTFNIGLKVCHFEMVIYPIDNEIWEPWILSASLEEFIEQLEALLSKVIAKYLETHQCLVLWESLSKEGKTHIIDLVIAHV